MALGLRNKICCEWIALNGEIKFCFDVRFHN